jgi:membrane protein
MRTAARTWRMLRLLTFRAVREFVDDRCLQAAAGISYWALFSLFPLAILAVAVLGLVLRDDSLRGDLLDVLLANLPLSSEGRADLEQALESVTSSRSTFGFLGLLALFWTASGLMGAIRDGLNRVWDTESRPPIRGKLLDFALVLVVAVGLLVSMALSVGLRVAEASVADVAEWLTAGFVVFGFLLPVVLTFATSAFLYRFVPAERTTFAQIWPGALVAALGFEAAKYGFAFYLANFDRYDAVYGSIGAVMATLFFMYLAANVFLFGAQIASEWPRARADAAAGRSSLP